FQAHCDAQSRGFAAPARADQRDDLAVAHAETQVSERRHRLCRTVDTQRKGLGDIDKLDRTHYFTCSSAFARSSGATILFRSTGFGMLPFLSNISCIQASFSIGRPMSGSISLWRTASSKMNPGRGSSGFALVISKVSLISSSRFVAA